MTDDTITFLAGEAEAEGSATPEQLAELATSAAELAEAAAIHAQSARELAEVHRDRCFAYAARAEGAKGRADALIAADAASAADAEAGRARLAYADAEVHVGFAEQHHGIIAAAEGDHDDELAAAAAAINRAQDAAAEARTARDRADTAARVAGQGVDWLRYHLDNRCRHWRDRVEPPTDDELQTASGLGPVPTADELAAIGEAPF